MDETCSTAMRSMAPVLGTMNTTAERIFHGEGSPFLWKVRGRREEDGGAPWDRGEEQPWGLSSFLHGLDEGKLNNIKEELREGVIAGI